MNLHEYQAKQLFKQYALPVSEGVVCKTADEAEMALFQLNGDVWIAKCQVHAGGRGKLEVCSSCIMQKKRVLLQINGLGSIWSPSKQIKKANLLIVFILKKPARLRKNFTLGQ